MKQDEADIVAVMNSINAFINPFDHEGEELISLISGNVASEQAQKDLLNVYAVGEEKLKEFLDKRVQRGDVDYFAPIKASKLATFYNQKRGKTALQAKAAIQASDRSLFARLLVISRARPLDLELILSHPLCAVSVPLASADGSMSKTNKSALMQNIEADCEDCILDTVDDVGAIIVDAMALVQALPNSAIPSTFGKLADSILDILIAKGRKYNSPRVDFVIDNYYDHSIKGGERSKRGDSRKKQHAHHKWRSQGANRLESISQVR